MCCRGHEQASDVAGWLRFVKNKITFGSFDEARPRPLQEGRVLGLPGSAPYLFTLPRWAGQGEPLPPPWTDSQDLPPGP